MDYIGKPGRVCDLRNTPGGLSALGKASNGVVWPVLSLVH